MIPPCSSRPGTAAAAALAATLLASCSPAAGSPEIHISDAWARETVAGQRSTAAYMTIRNSGAGSDRLIEVSAPEPLRASLHRSESTEGIARMRPLSSGLEVPAEESVILRPGGDHIMIERLGSPLEPGRRVTLSLRFERSGSRVVDFPVRSAGGAAEMHQAPRQ